MSFITIPNDVLSRIAVAMAAFGHDLTTRHQAVQIAAFANDPQNGFARTDGNLWKYPMRPARIGYFKPAFVAADSPVVTPKATKASKPTKASGKRVKGSPEAKAWGAEMAAARAAKRSGKAAPKPAAKPVQASGKLSTAERNAQVAALLSQAAALLAS
jgi:hypothetical protein